MTAGDRRRCDGSRKATVGRFERWVALGPSKATRGRGDAQRPLSGTVATTTASTTAEEEESGRGRGSLATVPILPIDPTTSIAAGTLLPPSLCPSIRLLPRGVGSGRKHAPTGDKEKPDMTDRADKQRIMTLLRRVGLWEEAEKYREEVRQRLRGEGKTKQEAVEGAWDAMAEKYLPLAEQASAGFRVVLPDGAESYDVIVDAGYNETDDAAEMRDVYRWIKEEFHRIVVDHSTGTIVDFRLAKKPPPTGLACKILETWAAKPREKRDGLYEKIQKHLSSAKESPEAEPLYEDDGFLDEIS